MASTILFYNTVTFILGTTPSNLWVGISVVGHFKWVDGSTKGALGKGSFWLPGKPSYTLHKNCIVAVAGSELPTTQEPRENLYKWEDTTCSIRNYYFCIEENKTLP